MMPEVYVGSMPDGEQLEGLARVIHELGSGSATLIIILLIVVLTGLYVWRMRVKDGQVNEALAEKDRTIRRISAENKAQRDLIMRMKGGPAQDDLMTQVSPHFQTDEPPPRKPTEAKSGKKRGPK